jgi:two-component system phosphate regulon sensor histidine kinase PhoR
MVGQNVRFAIRQPQVLEAIIQRRTGRLGVLGIGGIERSWDVAISRLDDTLLLVRLTDRSARRAAERAQVDFVANASHELRTPLAAVLGYSETLAEPGELNEAFRRRFGEQIHDQAQRMMRIIRDLMSLSRIEADRFLAPREQVKLVELVQDAVHAATPLAESRQCRVLVDVVGTLRPIRGDTAQLRQVVDNLLHNAIRYGCRGEDSAIAIRIEAHAGWQRLLVRDSGDGIAPEHLPRLTERFYRVDASRSRDGGGTGLGLAIVKQVIERHRGLLEIRSEPDQGTEVEVRLPER